MILETPLAKKKKKRNFSCNALSHSQGKVETQREITAVTSEGSPWAGETVASEPVTVHGGRPGP